jgi:hypothetical protein
VSADGPSPREKPLATSLSTTREDSLHPFKKLFCAFKRETGDIPFDVAEQIEIQCAGIT